MKKLLTILVILLLLIGSGVILFQFYPYIFAKDVEGRILKVERVTQPDTVISSGGGSVPSDQMFSFAVAIKDRKGEIHTASSIDRQWAVAQVSQCVEVKFLRYAPWQLETAGTFFGARLLRLFDCPTELQEPRVD